MKSIRELFNPWLYCQTLLKKTLRWSKYIQYEKGKSARYNRIRRQNVADHTLSKLLVCNMLLPELKAIFYGFSYIEIDSELLFSCILTHDFGEGLRKQKYDVLSFNKKGFHDVEEYTLFMTFLHESNVPLSIMYHVEKSFLLQFALTSYESFPPHAKNVMAKMRENETERNTAILFQILEKWEYHFYAYENRNKHPTIWRDVCANNQKIIAYWIGQYPEQFHKPLEELFMS